MHRTCTRLGLLAPFALGSFVTAQSAYLVDSNLDQLFSVDLVTGAATFIASTANNGLSTPADLSWRALTSELWTIDLGGGEVGTIDVTNGTFTAVYQTGLNGWQGMAWDETTQLFYLANQNGNNYALDPATGLTTLLGAAGFGLITCLDTDVNGNLYGIDFSTGTMVAISKVTGTGTGVGTTLTNLQGLGIDLVTGAWYGSSTNTHSLYDINPATGVATLIGAHGAGVVFAKGFDLVDGGVANVATKVAFGSGCVSSYASFYEQFNANFDLSGTSLQAINSGTGYLVLPGGSQWYTPTSTPVTMGDDVVLPFALGWTLPYPGATTTDLYVSSNGFVYLTNNTASGCCSGVVADLLSNTYGPRWAALWYDLNPSAGGAVYFDTDPVTGTAYVTFDQVPQYGTSNLNSFQYKFDVAGNVELRWGVCAIAASSVLVGWSPGANNRDPGPTDLSAITALITQPADVLPLRLGGDVRPVLGNTVNLTIDNIPAPALLSAVIFGLGKFDPGIPLAGMGMADCFQYCTMDSVVLAFGSPSAAVPFNVPNNPALAGVHIIAQGASYAPAAGLTSLGAISSNGLDLGLDVN